MFGVKSEDDMSFFKHEESLRLKTILNESKKRKNESKDEDKDNKSLKKYKQRDNKWCESGVSRSRQLALKSKQQLFESRFRAINQFLYSNPTSAANDYLNEELFADYHRIYDQIADKWPQKPIDYIIAKLQETIPKSKRLVIADIGCGNRAQIADAFPKQTVHSFDLVSTNSKITAADMSSLPLESAVCDSSVFCLSLMATNLKDCLSEANRILKPNGRLIIVEVLSRFDPNEDYFVRQLSSFGFELKSKEYLPPNRYFIYMEFSRRRVCRPSLPDLELKPCLYKRR